MLLSYDSIQDQSIAETFLMDTRRTCSVLFNNSDRRWSLTRCALPPFSLCVTPPCSPSNHQHIDRTVDAQRHLWQFHQFADVSCTERIGILMSDFNGIKAKICERLFTLNDSIEHLCIGIKVLHIQFISNTRERYRASRTPMLLA